MATVHQRIIDIAYNRRGKIVGVWWKSHGGWASKNQWKRTMKTLRPETHFTYVVVNLLPDYDEK